MGSLYHLADASTCNNSTDVSDTDLMADRSEIPKVGIDMCEILARRETLPEVCVFALIPSPGPKLSPGIVFNDVDVHCRLRLQLPLILRSHAVLTYYSIPWPVATGPSADSMQGVTDQGRHEREQQAPFAPSPLRSPNNLFVTNPWLEQRGQQPPVFQPLSTAEASFFVTDPREGTSAARTDLESDVES